MVTTASYHIATLFSNVRAIVSLIEWTYISGDTFGVIVVIPIQSTNSIELLHAKDLKQKRNILLEILLKSTEIEQNV